MLSINVDRFPCYIADIPFYYTNLNSSHNPTELVDVLDFELDYNHFTGTIIQKPNDRTQYFLNKAYNYGSQITGYMDDYELGEKYTQDFLSFIEKNENGISESRILEIGCGTGYLLFLLKNLGANVTGIEPGNQANIGINKYKINIIQDYYPSQQVSDKFDIIIFYNVLEHISDIESFLMNVKNQLNDDGRVYFSVPDCEKPIKHGDVSMLIHEHYNYFIKETLNNTFIEYLKSNVQIENSKFGAELFGLFVNSINSKSEQFLEVNCINGINNNYLKKILDKIKLFENFLKKIKIHNKTLGIYVPSRVINMLSLIRKNVDINNIEFFDDNTNLVGKYLPSFDIIIKSREDLISKPTDYVLIASYTFGSVIKNNIYKYLPSSTEIIKIEDLLGV